MAIKFKLFDSREEEYKVYSFDIDFEDMDDYENWEYSDNDIETFVDNMECGEEDYCGTLDFDGEGAFEDKECHVGYISCEIVNFEKALDKWREFFKSKGKLIE